MTNGNSIIDDQAAAGPRMTLNTFGPTPLTSAELDAVAAAGSKPGVGSGTDERPPVRPK